MPYIELNGVRIFYILHKVSPDGGTRSIVLIHGAGGNHLSMLSIFNYIRKKYGGIFNILVFDLPWHFRSLPVNSGNKHLPVPDNKGMDYYAETARALSSILLKESKAVILIGHSMGAQVCIKYASLFPDEAEKAMLIAGCHKTGVNGIFIESLERSFDRTIMLFLKDAAASKSKNILNNALTDIKRTSEQTVINDFKYIKYYSGHYDADLNAINGSRIIFNLIYSKKDLIIKDTCMAELHDKLVNSIIHGIPAKSHMDFLYENYFMEKEIDKFLLS
jgi:surfactin synthase thioesterase subunit